MAEVEAANCLVEAFGGVVADEAAVRDWGTLGLKMGE
jgi:hypothetical protein